MSWTVPALPHTPCDPTRQGRSNILKRWALLPRLCEHVEVHAQPAVVLGATTSAPDALDNLARKPTMQVRWGGGIQPAEAADVGQAGWGYTFAMVRHLSWSDRRLGRI